MHSVMVWIGVDRYGGQGETKFAAVAGYAVALHAHFAAQLLDDAARNGQT